MNASLLNLSHIMLILFGSFFTSPSQKGSCRPTKLSAWVNGSA